VRFAFIAVEKAAFPVRLLCRTLQVSRAGFYAWQGRPPAPRVQADDRLGLEIAAIHAESRQRYGSPRIHAGGPRLPHGEEARGTPDAAPRVGCPAPATLPGDDPLVAPVSDRAQRLGARVRAGAPNQAWVTDITYSPTGKGWL
jgi:transposase InsO family protein